MTEAKQFKYEGEKLDVSWDGRLCIHVGECGRSEGDLFVGDRKPWCQPDSSESAYVEEVMLRCPSGALVALRKDGTPVERSPDPNQVLVSNDGPLYVRGEIELEGAPDDMPGVRHRVALCRCGQSKNKPFCDNSHRGAGFRDSGAVGKKGDPDLQAQGGQLRIKPAKDGPLLVNGQFAIVAGSGRAAWRGNKAALCRCGQSKNKPFCDGSHTAAGFTSG
jgi:CDGSH-type Zn-finger protein/uncharacterized Fe-S cluster protein YjdI